MRGKYEGGGVISKVVNDAHRWAVDGIQGEGFAWAKPAEKLNHFPLGVQKIIQARNIEGIKEEHGHHDWLFRGPQRSVGDGERIGGVRLRGRAGVRLRHLNGENRDRLGAAVVGKDEIVASQIADGFAAFVVGHNADLDQPRGHLQDVFVRLLSEGGLRQQRADWAGAQEYRAEPQAGTLTRAHGRSRLQCTRGACCAFPPRRDDSAGQTP